MDNSTLESVPCFGLLPIDVRKSIHGVKKKKRGRRENSWTTVTMGERRLLLSGPVFF